MKKFQGETAGGEEEDEEDEEEEEGETWGQGAGA
jgi:hypothetical protein